MSYYTYQYEDQLPRLPVPSLSSTTQQLLTALKPLLSQEEYDELFEESSEFIADDLINLIQSHLVAASNNPVHSCYLNSVNDETNPGIYGELKGDILPRNPYLILEEDPYSKTINPPNQPQRAANLINSSLKFIVSLRNETLKPDLTPKHGNPLTMNCYKNLFGTTRIPDLAEDYHHVTIKKYKHINDSRHIIIICNNQYYKLEVLTKFRQEEYNETESKHKIWFNDHELSLILQQIIDRSNKVDQIESINNSIGSLTTQTFSTWKLARVELAKSNELNLSLIDDALFIVVLDPNSPTTDQEKTSVISHGSSDLLPGTNIQVGSCTSRWYDKLQLIVTNNSVAGVVWESTSMDSTAILRFISDMYTDSILKLAKNINGSEYTLFDNNVSFVSPNGNIIKPNAIQLKINKTPELQTLIHLSETRLADIINQHEYKTLNLKLDTHMIMNFNISIDSILQISFQITHYTLYGKMANTLEPITTRKFKNSRTELIPIQNDLISRLVKLFITNSNPSEKWELFKECCNNHTKQYHDAMSGRGFERHFMSLVHVVNRPKAIEYLNNLNKNLPLIPDLSAIKNLEIPLLSNPIIERIFSPELLISNCGNNALRLFGIPPAADQGYGIGYIIHNDKVIITVCSKYRQTGRFLDTFKQVISDLKLILKQKSNFLLHINDSKVRKLELQKLRIEHELKNVDHNLPSTRHPIQLTIDELEPIPFENVKIDKSFTGPRPHSISSESTSSNNDYDLLGGYGYFDYGELDLRSDELSRNESFLNSHSSLGSNLNSKHHSSTNLHKLFQLSNANDLKQKMSLSESIRDKLSHSIDSFAQNDSDYSKSSSSSNVSSNKPKNQIGRKLEICNFP